MHKSSEIAALIDHAVLHPTATDKDLLEACTLAEKYRVASLCVKPYAVSRAVEMMNDPHTRVGCVIGFPAGNSAIDVKYFEARRACEDGAGEIDMVLNLAKVIEEDWTYINEEIGAVTELCHRHNALIKVIFETDYVTATNAIVKLCQICTELKVDYVKTSTGFGYNKTTDGHYAYTGATLDNIRLMKKSVGPDVGVKASGGIRTLDSLLAMYEAGASRIGTSSTQAIMRESFGRFEHS
jgi:deoxyribose-phosphate aldolase